MLHINPILEKDASEEVKRVYADIRETLGVPTVPQVFAYLGNFPSYLPLVWGQLKANYCTEIFSHQRDMLIEAVVSGMNQIGERTDEISSYLLSLSPEDFRSIYISTTKVLHAHTSLLLMLIAIRENVKGVYAVEQKVLSPGKMHPSTLDEAKSLLMPQNLQGNIFSSSGLSLSLTSPDYEAFLGLVGDQFETLTGTQSYLVLRLFLEKQAVGFVKSWEQPLSLPYGDMITLIKTNPLFPELLYVLVNVFPAEFARLILLSGYMESQFSEIPSLIE